MEKWTRGQWVHVTLGLHQFQFLQHNDTKGNKKEKQNGKDLSWVKSLVLETCLRRHSQACNLPMVDEKLRLEDDLIFYIFLAKNVDLQLFSSIFLIT